MRKKDISWVIIRIEIKMKSSALLPSNLPRVIDRSNLSPHTAFHFYFLNTTRLDRFIIHLAMVLYQRMLLRLYVDIPSNSMTLRRVALARMFKEAGLRSPRTQLTKVKIENSV